MARNGRPIRDTDQWYWEIRPKLLAVVRESIGFTPDVPTGDAILDACDALIEAARNAVEWKTD